MSVKIKDKLLLQPKDFEPSFKTWEITGVLNPAAVRMRNGKICLMVRVAEKHDSKGEGTMTCPVITTSDNHMEAKYQKIKKKDVIKVGKWHEMYLKDGTCRLPNISHFKKVILSKNGFEVESIEQRPSFTGHPSDGDYGVEDPRITKIDKKYYMTYVGISTNEGVSTYLASSNDLKKWKRHGLIFREQNKDVVLFPEKINGRYVALNRPESMFHFSRPGIWISYSPNLIYWGKDKNLLRVRDKSWETERNGSGCPPLKTKDGWLIIYHGVKNMETEKGEVGVYSAGAALLDLKNPEKILARSPTNKPLIKPTKKYEKNGFINNVVFPTGLVEDKNGKDLLIYAGGGDKVISVRKISKKNILNSMEYY